MVNQTANHVPLTPLLVGLVLLAPAQGQFIQQGSKLVGTGTASTISEQGSSVAISADGKTAIVGGYWDNNNAGAAWVFARTSGVWYQQGPKLVGSGASGSANQGYSVALSGDGNTALIGSQGAGAWVFTRSGGAWTQQGSRLVGQGAVIGAREQGWSVALSADGNTALVGERSGEGNQSLDEGGLDIAQRTHRVS